MRTNTLNDFSGVTFGAKCSPSIAQYVKNQNAERYQLTNPRAVKAIVDNHYVDDWLDSVDAQEEAVQLANDVKAIHKEGGFEIRNFISNSVKVMEQLEHCENKDTKNLSLSTQMASEKVLGMWWSTSSDTFSYSPTNHK